MVCIRCQKRPAIIFVQRMENGQMKNEGYCLHCAREMHIKPVDDLMKQFGMSDEDMDAMEDRMENMMQEMGDMSNMNPFSMMMGMGQPDQSEEDGDLVPGSSATFPLGVNGGAQNGKNEKKAGKNDKKPPRRKFLDTYCENLTRKAREGKLDDIIGRDREIYRTIQILSRRQKNNPCLIGEAGVGKTAIAEGIAERIAKGQVPAGLQDKEIFLLDLTSLVAGTQFRGQFEQRVKGLLSEVKAAGNVILFIDEIHTITSAGESEGAMNAGNILKPALSRGEIQVIGATTFNEYRKYIEKDQALERRFQPVRVEEPSVADTLAVMGGIKHYYEEHHHVQVPADVLNATVTLSERYITDRYLPDKAIDLLDGACACCNLAHPVISEYLTMQKELEALKQEEADMENADVNEPIDYERVAERKTRMAQLERELPAKQAAAGEIQVTMDDVAKVIELWTGIPAVKIRETEYAKLASLETELKKKIIGQDDAVHLVAQAVKRSRADLSGRRRPASFIFVGPTGVGKTELVKQLANQLFDGPDPLIRLDMSEYMEKYAVSRMIGSPPGYVGYEEAGQLTEKVRRRPYSVVLFDEIEKAHPDVMNILLQILDEGKINDAQGRTVDFSNTVICMTSNAGSSDQTTASLGFNRSEEERNEEKSRKALSQFLRPEFLGRVDEVITFKPLSEETLQGIAALMLDEYKPSMEAKGIAYSYTPAALAALVHKSQGGKFGARDLRRTIRKSVEDPAAEKIIDGTLVSGSTLTVDAENDEIVLK
ncbi:ATP-dependent Clp protease ATP-binding subunit [Faecalibacterium prausnitzii]|uniref:ATP-dependent Clp protease ATP-binding subunit n=1 Tax=Faecalibacterium prausnitzii TaxID=853 RepID=UPI0012DCEF89|nr:ATP-dependent Clp protease ATP-binding subunit [Faecalibacterium prausnitzii]